MSGLYIHIPFCRSRCIYCGFYSTTHTHLRKGYVHALCREINLRKDYIDGDLSTIYLGGGTPSQLDKDELEFLFNCIYNVYSIEKDAEITMECNPDDVTETFASILRQLPVNRISMGVQTFSDCRLKFLHRRHTAEEVDNAIKLLRHIGIDNISIDLMFGFPNETLADWSSDINHALELNVEHISAYSLTYEKQTPLWQMLKYGKITEIDEEKSLAMYNELINRLTAAGYEHYEISNFARLNYRSRHNSSYWKGTPYIGIGAAAHSYNKVSRQWNVADVQKYIESINKGLVPAEQEDLDKNTQFNDIVTTALRTRDGICLDSLEHYLGKEYKHTLMKYAEPQIRSGFLKLYNGRLSLTRKGLFISNTIMSELMIV